MVKQELVAQWQPTLAQYVTNPDNSKLKSLESLTSLVDAIEKEIERRYQLEWTAEEYTTLALNIIYHDRERLGKAGHKLSDDAIKAVTFFVDAIRPNSSVYDFRCEVYIHSPDANEQERIRNARQQFYANQQARQAKKATVPPEPVIPVMEPREPVNTCTEPTPQPEPVPEPEPQPQPRRAYALPTEPGYIIPEEYGLIHYNLSNNTDICIEGDASAGKSLTIEVMCKTEGWNLVQIGKVIDDTMLKGFMNPITKEFTPSKLIRALKHDPEVCPIEGAKTVVCFDEGFTNMADYLTTLLPLVGRKTGGYIATENEVVLRGDTVFVFIDNSTGDGGTTNYLSRKPIDMALKSRLFFVHMKLSPKIAKAICKDDKELYKFTEWMRKAVAKGKVDRLSLDNRGLEMIQKMKEWDGFTDEMLGEILYGSFFKGCPPASLATLLRNVSAKPEELQANRYFVATQNYYLKLCKACGLSSDPQAVKA